MINFSKKNCCKFFAFFIFLLSFLSALKISKADDDTIDYSGNDKHVEMSYNSSLNPTGAYTVSAWVKHETNVNDYQSIIYGECVFKEKDGERLYKFDTDFLEFVYDNSPIYIQNHILKDLSHIKTSEFVLMNFGVSESNLFFSAEYGKISKKYVTICKNIQNMGNV